MSGEQALPQLQALDESESVLFTVERANQAIVLVRKIVADIVTQYRRLLTLRDERQELSYVLGEQTRMVELQDGIDTTIIALDSLNDELSSIGCVLKDWAVGLVDFPAEYQGRRVCLCWRLDEPAVAHWHESEAGFSGRQPIGPDFK